MPGLNSGLRREGRIYTLSNSPEYSKAKSAFVKVMITLPPLDSLLETARSRFFAKANAVPPGSLTR